MAQRRSPEAPAREALYREIPDTMIEEDVTGVGTVDEIDLTSYAGRWVWLTPKGGDAYLRRFAGTAPESAEMVKGRVWAEDVTEEVYIDANSAALGLAVEGTAAMTLVIEYGSGA